MDPLVYLDDVIFLSKKEDKLLNIPIVFEISDLFVLFYPQKTELLRKQESSPLLDFGSRLAPAKAGGRNDRLKAILKFSNRKLLHSGPLSCA